MRGIKTPMKSLFFLLALLALWGCATLPEHYRSVATGQSLKFNEILSKVENRRVIFVGERHTSGGDHLVQLEVIRYLHEKGKKVAIALEMFPAEMQGVLDRWNEGFLSDEGFERAYGRVWHEPFSYYEDIFAYARKEKIPLVGINGVAGQIEHIAMIGLQAVPADTLKEIAYSPCAEQPRYRWMITLFLKYGTPHAADLPFFCDAQRFRDTVMAYSVAAALKKNVDVVVVLAGSAHVLKAAVPDILRRYTGVRFTVLMSGAFGPLIRVMPENETADYLWY
jgi:aminopeptidase N